MMPRLVVHMLWQWQLLRYMHLRICVSMQGRALLVGLQQHAIVALHASHNFDDVYEVAARDQARMHLQEKMDRSQQSKCCIFVQ